MAFRDYSINIEKQINRLLPYYLRGRKMMLFLHAISSPLQFFNTGDSEFNKWAHRRLLDLSMNAQKMRLVWYLNNITIPDNEIELRPNGQIAINDEATSATIAYLRSEIRDQSTAPLFYPHSIPTVLRLRSNSTDKAKAKIVTRRMNELGSVGGRFTITVPYAGQDREDVSRMISASIGRFIPVGITYRIVFI